MSKPLLTSSLLLNLSLGILLLFALQSANKPAAPSAPFIQSSQKELHPADNSQSSSDHVWHWKDLDSEEFPTFIANLRSFGCPEQTIRDIVTAEINRDYDQKLADLNSTQLASGQYALAKSKLDEERLKVLDELFPSAGNHHAKLSNQGSTAQAGTESSPPEQPVATPLVLLQPDPSLHFDEAQMNAWKALQRNFMAKIGSTQNPYDPEYRKRWEEAQKDLDQAFQSKFGDDAFNLLLEKRKLADSPQ